GQLEAALNRLGAGVAEKEPVEPRRGDLCKEFRRCDRCLVVEDPAGMDEPGQLLRDPGHDPRMVVADVQDPEPRGAVQITLSLHVDYPAPLPPLDGDRVVEMEGGGEDPVAPLDNFAVHD